METDIKWVNFVHCTDLNAFTANKYSETNTEGKITNDNIVFIKKEKLIWTNDQFYTCDGDAIQELANNLGLLGTELSDFKTYVETTFAKIAYVDSEISATLTSAKKYADGAHTAIPTTDINKLFN